MRYRTRHTCYRTLGELSDAIARNQPALNAATEAWLTAKREYGSNSPQELALWPELDRLEMIKVHILIDASQMAVEGAGDARS